MEKFKNDPFWPFMEKVIQEEGARLVEENERLLADSSAEVPAHVNQRIFALFDQHFPKR